MAGADDHGVLALEAFPVSEVGDAVGKGLRGPRLADRGEAVGAGRIGRRPRARGVDDRAREKAVLLSLFGGDVDDEGLLPASRVDEAVAPAARHTRHAAAVANALAEDRGERGEVLLDPLRARREAGRGGGPAGGLEEAVGGGIHQFGPFGEQAHVAPLLHGRSGGGSGLQYDDRHVALDQVGGRGQPLGSRADHGDRQHVLHRSPHLSSTNLDG